MTKHKSKTLSLLLAIVMLFSVVASIPSTKVFAIDGLETLTPRDPLPDSNPNVPLSKGPRKTAALYNGELNKWEINVEFEIDASGLKPGGTLNAVTTISDNYGSMFELASVPTINYGSVSYDETLRTISATVNAREDLPSFDKHTVKLTYYVRLISDGEYKASLSDYSLFDFIIPLSNVDWSMSTSIAGSEHSTNFVQPEMMPAGIRLINVLNKPVIASIWEKGGAKVYEKELQPKESFLYDGPLSYDKRYEVKAVDKNGFEVFGTLEKGAPFEKESWETAENFQLVKNEGWIAECLVSWDSLAIIYLNTTGGPGGYPASILVRYFEKNTQGEYVLTDSKEVKAPHNETIIKQHIPDSENGLEFSHWENIEKDPGTPLIPGNVQLLKDNTDYYAQYKISNDYDKISVLKVATKVEDKNGNAYDEPKFQAVGDRIYYEFRITNTGTTNVDTLVVSDAKLGIMETVDLTETPLTPRGIYVYTPANPYIITQEDIDAGSVSNIVSVSTPNQDPKDPPVTDREEVEKDSFDKFTVVKVATKVEDKYEKVYDEPKFQAVGDKIYYEFKITNTGQTNIRQLTIVDEKLDVHETVDLTNSPLVPGTSFTYTAPKPYVITQDDITNGKVDNIVRVSTPNQDPNEPPVEDDETVYGGEKVKVVKTATTVVDKSGADRDSKVFREVGDKIFYRFEITNIGAVPIDGLKIVDEKLGVNENVNLKDNVLKPDEKYIYDVKVPYVVTEEDIKAGVVHNVVSVHTPNGDPNKPATDEENTPKELAACFWEINIDGEWVKTRCIPADEVGNLITPNPEDPAQSCLFWNEEGKQVKIDFAEGVNIQKYTDFYCNYKKEINVCFWEKDEHGVYENKGCIKTETGDFTFPNKANPDTDTQIFTEWGDAQIPTETFDEGDNHKVDRDWNFYAQYKKPQQEITVIVRFEAPPEIKRPDRVQVVVNEGTYFYSNENDWKGRVPVDDIMSVFYTTENLDNFNKDIYDTIKENGVLEIVYRAKLVQPPEKLTNLPATGENKSVVPIILVVVAVGLSALVLFLKRRNKEVEDEHVNNNTDNTDNTDDTNNSSNNNQ